MKKWLLPIIALALVGGSLWAVDAAARPLWAGTGACGGTGLNSADADGDGIPNCVDPDYVPPRDGTGRQLGRGFLVPAGPYGMVVWMPVRSLWGGWGPGDGTGNGGVGPRDGSGFGPGGIGGRR
jgi:hypothetical protein